MFRPEAAVYKCSSKKVLLKIRVFVSANISVYLHDI